jgi:hypothetical protein
MIAANDEWRSRKVLASLDREPAIAQEKPPAKALEYGATSGRRLKQAFRFA